MWLWWRCYRGNRGACGASVSGRTLAISRCSKRVRTAKVLQPIMLATGFKPAHASYSVASAFGSAQFKANVCALIDMLILGGTNFSIVWCFTVLFAVDILVRRWYISNGGVPVSGVQGGAAALCLSFAVAIAGSAAVIASPTVNVLAGLQPAMPGMVSAVVVGLCAPAAAGIVATAARQQQRAGSGQRGCCQCRSRGDFEVAWAWAFGAAYLAAFLYSGATLGAASASQASLLLPAVTLFTPFFLGCCSAWLVSMASASDIKKAHLDGSLVKGVAGCCTLLLVMVVLPVVMHLAR